MMTIDKDGMDEEVNRDRTCWADVMNLEVDFKGEVMHNYLNERYVIVRMMTLTE